MEYDQAEKEETEQYLYDSADVDTEDGESLFNVEVVKEETEYEEIEYLEDDGDVKEESAESSSSKHSNSQNKNKRKITQSDDDDEDAEPPKRKWPKKLPRAERYKTYKQYTQEQLLKCMEAVRTGVMTPAEASESYTVPRKTILAKMKEGPKEYIDVNMEKTIQFINEIKTILTYTNATPYKSKNIRYYCAYCSTDGPIFEDPDDLRAHTRLQHVVDRTEKIDYFLRPYWMNEVLKIDIDNLICTICCIAIPTWNEMFKHLKQEHNVNLDLAYTRVIPYILRSEPQCALCKETFTNYMNLDGHMNAHYENYVCDDCGDTFLAENRLKQHVKIHAIGKYRCTMCPKVFSLDKYRRKHEELVHKQLAKFKCQYCSEKFVGEYLRHLHCLEMHKDTIKSITCELCGKTFTWKPYYVSHMKKKHSNSKRHECDECSRKFTSKAELKEHVLKHKGRTTFDCPVCPKKYVSMASLKQHLKVHTK